MKFKKNISLMLSIVLALSLVGGCDFSPQEKNDKLKIVTTIFPTYDWAKGVLGDKVADYDITFLTNTGLELHSYTPTVADIVKIAEADLFIYVGSQSDLWVDYTLDQVTNENQLRLNLLDIVQEELREKEIKEGVQIVEDDCCEDDLFDEHVWMSINNAILVSAEIQNALCQIDPDNEEYYISSGSQYLQDLSDLDSLYRESLANQDLRTVIFPDRFPFLYLFSDYDLDYFAAFSSCTSETEVSFQTLAYLTDKLNELDVDYVFNVSGANHNIAQAVIENSQNKQQEILYLSAMESITDSDVKQGTTYISIMKNNLDTLLIALGE